jgi:cytidylate kinase
MSIITISRQSGCEANEVARILCQKLNYHLLNKELMTDLAEELQQEPSQAEEPPTVPKAAAWLERVLNPFYNPNDPHYVAQKEISFASGQPLTIRQVRELIQAAYARGNIVIVGRGSQVILAGKPDVLHVRLIGSPEKRIQMWQKRESLSYDEAKKRMEKRDRAHVDFVKNYFDADITRQEWYDLIISIDHFTKDAIAELILQALPRMTFSS